MLEQVSLPTCIILARPLPIGFSLYNFNASFRAHTYFCFIFFALSTCSLWPEDTLILTLPRITILSFPWICMVLTHPFVVMILLL